MPASLTSPINEHLQQTLLQVAWQAIDQGFARSGSWQPLLQEYPEQLAKHGASFVTLTKRAQLRGCIGTLEAYQPLLHDVALHAYDAGFRDPRFTPLQKGELESLELHISLLTEPQPLPPKLSETELLAALVPFQDGLILRQGMQTAVFLPQVWQQLPDPQEFLRRLKQKGGWLASAPTQKMKCAKFQVQEFGEQYTNQHTTQ